MSSDFDEVDGCCLPKLVAQQTSVLSSISDSDPCSPSPGATGGGSFQDQPPRTCTENPYDPGEAATRCVITVMQRTAAAKVQQFDWNKVDHLEFEKLRIFLGKKDWAVAYYDEADGFHVEICDITEEAAWQQVSELKLSIPVIFDSPDECKYEQCSMIRPGDRLKNERTGKEGIFSGTIGSCPQKVYGLTAAHAVHDETETENTEVVKLFNDDDVLSRKDIIIKEVTCSNEEKVTADIRLLNLEGSVISCNEIDVVENITSMQIGRYKPAMYRDKTGELRGKNIAVRNRRKVLLEGVIDHCSFTNKKENLFNTISVLNIEGCPSPIIEPGDSGALVWLVPPGNPSVEELDVVGIVIGRIWFKQKWMAIVNKLHIVLCECKVFGTNPCHAGFYDFNN